MLMQLEHNKFLLVSGFSRNVCITIPPKHILRLMSTWIRLSEMWDDEMTAKQIRRISKYTIRSLDAPFFYHHAFGSINVRKGDIKHWVLRINVLIYKSVKIGIIDYKCINPKMRDFTNQNSFGYGLSLLDSGILSHRNIKKRYNYFAKLKQQTVMIKVELDMKTQQNGVLRYYSDSDISMNSNELDNSAYDDIDITRQYRLCIALGNNADTLTLIIDNSKHHQNP
eukprot:221907_1